MTILTRLARSLCVRLGSARSCSGRAGFPNQPVRPAYSGQYEDLGDVELSPEENAEAERQMGLVSKMRRHYEDKMLRQERDYDNKGG